MTTLPEDIKSKKKVRIDWRVSCVAIICLTLLEIAAMSFGINGTFRTFIFTAIALIAGINIDRTKIQW